MYVTNKDVLHKEAELKLCQVYKQDGHCGDPISCEDNYYPYTPTPSLFAHSKLFMIEFYHSRKLLPSRTLKLAFMSPFSHCQKQH